MADSDRTGSISSSCHSDPNFATICSFIQHFGEMIGIGHIMFEELRKMIECTKAVPDTLVRLHIKLLMKYFTKRISPSTWPTWLVRFARSSQLFDVARDLEMLTYKNISTGNKLKLLKTLLEAQFDRNRRFKLQVNAMEAEDIRPSPLGRDQEGRLYWCQVDSDVNLQVTRENLENREWKTVITSKDQIDEVVQRLQSSKAY